MSALEGSRRQLDRAIVGSSAILVALGLSLRLLPPEAQSLIVAGALLSITLNPLVFFIVSKCFKKQTPATTRS